MECKLITNMPFINKKTHLSIFYRIVTSRSALINLANVLIVGDLRTTHESLNKQVQNTYLPPPPPSSSSSTNIPPLMPPQELRNFPPTTAAHKDVDAKVLFPFFIPQSFFFNFFFFFVTVFFFLKAIALLKFYYCYPSLWQTGIASSKLIFCTLTIHYFSPVWVYGVMVLDVGFEFPRPVFNSQKVPNTTWYWSWAN